MPSLRDFYDRYPRVEAAFQAALDASLNPRSPELLYEIVGELGLPPGAKVLDLGCGEGRHSIRLAKSFGLAVHGVDPVRRHVELANERLDEAAGRDPELRGLVQLELGVAQALPVRDAIFELIWCREALYHLESVHEVFAECRRVLRTDGRMLVYQNFRTDRLEPREAQWQWATSGTVPANADAQHIESAFAGAGFQVVRRIDLASEFGEYSEENGGQAARQLIHAARLLRDPRRYIAMFGQTNYDIMLGDCLWHVYRMIGKLSSRVYLLSAGGAARADD